MKYYKITNQKENHYGLQYHDGEVTDILPFNPQGDCQSGGIYFAREDILSFLYCGPWIREVTPIGKIYKNPGSPKKWKAHKVILGKRRKITLKVIKELIEEGADPKANDSQALLLAAIYGHLEIVKLLLPLSNPKANNSDALRFAALHGHLDVAKLLLPVSDPKAYNSQALRYAATYGHLEVVKLLLPLSDPKANDSEALRWAAYNGHLEVVKLLLPVSDPKARNSDALRLAAINGHLEIVKLLSPVSDSKDGILTPI
jgi:ankyrin repeat protein